MKVPKSSKGKEIPKYIRIKDMHGHFLAESHEDGIVCIYCRRCKRFYSLGNIQNSNVKNGTIVLEISCKCTKHQIPNRVSASGEEL
jgi:hypothetical protein